MFLPSKEANSIAFFMLVVVFMRGERIFNSKEKRKEGLIVAKVGKWVLI